MVARRNIYKGVYLQRGNGIGSVLSGLFRMLVPFVKNIARSAPAKRAIKSAQKSAIRLASNAAGEIVSGRNPKSRAKIDLKRAQANIEKALVGPSKTKNRTKKRKLAPGRVAPLI